MGLPIFILEAGTQVGIKVGNETTYYKRDDVEVYSTSESLVGLIDTKNNIVIVEAKTTDYREPKEASVRDLVEKIKGILTTVPALQLTLDELEAIQNANSPDSLNPFTTQNDLVGFTKFLGNWDANANTPALSSGVGTIGDTYRVSVAGTTNLDGITDWQIGDRVYFDGAAWQKSDNTDQVSSVFGRQGAVAAQTGDYDANQVDFTPNGDIAATDVQAAIVEVRDDADTKLSTKEDTANKGVANGYASLDAGGFLPTTQLPAVITSQVKQDSANWVGNGQNIRVGSSWVDFASEDFDTNTMHDNTVYVSGTATGTHSATTLQDTSKSWTVNEWAGYTVKITGGTNGDEVAKIVSNTADTLTIDAAWITTVDNTSTYEITLRGRITIPEDGKYLVSPRLTFSASAGRLIGLFIYKNNTFFNSIFYTAIAVESTVVLPPELMDLTSGDYIEIKAYQGGAGAHPLLSFGSRNRVNATKLGN